MISRSGWNSSAGERMNHSTPGRTMSLRIVSITIEKANMKAGLSQRGSVARGHVLVPASHVRNAAAKGERAQNARRVRTEVPGKRGIVTRFTIRPQHAGNKITSAVTNRTSLARRS